MTLTDSERIANSETLQHIQRVRNLLGMAIREITKRAELHDLSKLEPPEVSVFAENTAKLKGLTFMSDEYRACLANMKPALDHHYEANRHHPEHFAWRCTHCSINYARQDAYRCGEIAACHMCGSELTYDLKTGIENMDLIDLIEMIIDWKAASERHADGDIRSSITKNAERFGIGKQLQSILIKTTRYFDEKITVRESMDLLTAEERLHVMSFYCKDCGRDLRATRNNRCNCSRDE